MKKPTISFEIFPPKGSSNIESIYSTIDALAPLRPDYISVTYGAGGSNQQNTLEIASLLKNKYDIEPVAHLTCVGATKASIDEILDKFEAAGVSRILALRGDLPNEDALGDFKYASDLVTYIKARGGFEVVGACYPEKHLEAYSLEEDLINLKHKVDQGTEMLVSQLFFDNQVFYEWEQKARAHGVEVPIVAGIMPITSAKQLERMVTLCGATIPKEIQQLVKAYGHNAQALREAGIAYATMQIIDLLAHGVDGIHLYTMNQADIAKKIMENIGTIAYAVSWQRGAK
ncbi:MAG: methylenetetrahydrofolate reductase [NAD(P)H] [Cellulosilyticaceae bacterium]